ncbi:MAG: hypothetical protein N2260_08495 [Syntrophobacterales bacterium]|nr:hypothetical protein [Syntrophobacterales bacterium]
MDDKKPPEEYCVCWARNGPVITPREEEILREIRSVRSQYDEVKEALSKESDESRYRELEIKLRELKMRREELERLRIEAAKERMRLLGHED